jgi:Methyladenine glycosylase
MPEMPAKTPLAEAVSIGLKQRGFKFVGPTMVYAMMQANGMVNDHMVDCFRHDECNAIGQRLAWPWGGNAPVLAPQTHVKTTARGQAKRPGTLSGKVELASVASEKRSLSTIAQDEATPPRRRRLQRKSPSKSASVPLEVQGAT